MTIETIAAEYTIANGGGTFDARTLLSVKPTQGYAVALVSGTFLKVGPHEGGTGHFSRVEFIAAAIRSVRLAYPDAPYIGTWVADDGTTHVDPVVILYALDDAVRVGRALGQDAIYAFRVDGGRSIDL